MENTYSLEASKATAWELEINGNIISEDVIEALGIEYDTAQGYLEHLKECTEEGENHSEYIKVGSIIDEMGVELILIERNQKGSQVALVNGSDAFNEVCQMLIKKEKGMENG